MAVRVMSRRGPFEMTEKSSDRIGGPIGLRNRAGTSRFSYSVMVGIGLGGEVGAVVYGLFRRLLGGGGTVQVGSGSA
jgi:hypothetical protein